MAKRVNGRINMRESDLRRTVSDAVSRAFNVCIAVTLLSAHDEFGFGGQRLRRFLGRITRNVQALNRGDIRIEEVIQALADDDIIVGFTKEDVKGAIR